jgi:hypothetical protein
MLEHPGMKFSQDFLLLEILPRKRLRQEDANQVQTSRIPQAYLRYYVNECRKRDKARFPRNSIDGGRLQPSPRTIQHGMWFHRIVTIAISWYMPRAA